MFRRTLTCALAIGCALSLSACNTTTDQAKITAFETSAKVTTSKVKAVALKLDSGCHGIVPTAESVASILAAANGTVATVEMAVDLACKALDLGVAYTADSPDPLPPKKPKKGGTVTGTVVVNGKLVPVAGTVAK